MCIELMMSLNLWSHAACWSGVSGPMTFSRKRRWAYRTYITVLYSRDVCGLGFCRFISARCVSIIVCRLLSSGCIYQAHIMWAVHRMIRFGKLWIFDVPSSLVPHILLRTFVFVVELLVGTWALWSEKRGIWLFLSEGTFVFCRHCKIVNFLQFF